MRAFVRAELQPQPRRRPSLAAVAWCRGPHCPHPLNRCSPRQRLLQQKQAQRQTACQATSFVDAVQSAAAAASLPSPGLHSGLLVNSLVFLLGIKVLLRGLTWGGVLNSWLLGSLVYSAFGPGGYLLVCLYFIFGSAVTKVKLAQKQQEGIAEARSGRRSVGSVWGSGLAGMACAAAALATGNTAFWQIGFVASFSSKLSDTVSSEIGKAYGRTTYLCTTLQRVPRGTEGAISLEGTAAGALAAAAFGAIAFAVGQVDLSGVVIVSVAAVVANFVESVLGASVQGSIDWLTNDVINMIQISLAAAIAVGLSVAWGV